MKLLYAQTLLCDAVASYIAATHVWSDTHTLLCDASSIVAKMFICLFLVSWILGFCIMHATPSKSELLLLHK